jgi:hypothetical protein
LIGIGCVDVIDSDMETFFLFFVDPFVGEMIQTVECMEFLRIVDKFRKYLMAVLNRNT